MTDGFQVQKFNDDLLSEPQDQATARQVFPTVFHVLDDEELRALFKTYDDPANRAKKRSLRAGILAVVFVVAALFGTSAEHLYENTSYAKWIAIASSLLGVFGVAVGLGGVMIGRSKKEWLYQRMMGEWLRQFHFQTFVCRTNDIVESLKGKTQQSRFLANRKAWLSEIQLRFAPHLEAEFHALLQNEQAAGAWLHPAPRELDATVLNTLPEDFFAAYRALRILHQRQYAHWKLRYGQDVLSGLSLRSLETFLANGSVLATVCLVITEILIILPLLMNLSPDRFPVFGVWAHWIAICFAVAALGMRTLEDGLQPKRELERYQRYSVSIQDILERFDAGPRLVKFETMIEMERLAFEEMRGFLRTSYASRFVM